MRVFSNGGGVQSTAALVLSAQDKIDYPVHLFANVGDDSENPTTIQYVRNVAIPFAKAHGIEMLEIQRDGDTLYQHITKPSRSIDIPMRFPNGKPGNRNCTNRYKRTVIRKWLGNGKHVVGLGISVDEFQRARTDSGFANIVNEYPLIDLRLSRSDCVRIIQEAGLPLPPKSSCWFCPFKSKRAWADLRRQQGELFDRASDLEQLLSERSVSLGHSPMFLTGTGKALRDAVSDQPILFDVEDSCESGYCMT